MTTVEEEIDPMKLFFIIVVATIIPTVLVKLIACRIRFSRNRKVKIFDEKQCKDETIIGFFHPKCSSGGGGERVLWKAIETLGEMREAGLNIAVVVYTTDKATSHYKAELFAKVKERFSISISQSLPLRIVHMYYVVERLQTSSKPRKLSMIGEAVESMVLAFEAMSRVTPHLYFDTTGCAFTFLIAKLLAGCKVVAYIHYPTISTDMLNLVWERRPSYNNPTEITQSSFKSYLKFLYYTVFALAYGMVGSMADVVMVNSTWTFNHIYSLWRMARNRIHVVYPPVDTDSLVTLDIERVGERKNIVLSIGQFRPEKDHALQLRSFARLFTDHGSKMHQLPSGILGNEKGSPKMVLFGSCRGEEDKKRVRDLRKLTDELGISKHVRFVLNQPYSELKNWLSQASIGIHTMWNEHFGIGVVEMMAAGLVTIAHNSGGPKTDIIVPLPEDQAKAVNANTNVTGYLATTEEEYACEMFEALQNGPDRERNRRVRCAGRESAKRFSDHIFKNSFKKVMIESDVLK